MGFCCHSVVRDLLQMLQILDEQNYKQGMTTCENGLDG